MFFRRQQPAPPSFEDRLSALAGMAFAIARQPDGAVRATRGGCAAVVRPVDSGPPHIDRAGWLMGGSIAALVDGGFQKFWAVDGKRRAPALASQLEALHAFEEDLREGLGLESLYNASLGTTNDYHVYDRVEGRESA